MSTLHPSQLYPFHQIPLRTDEEYDHWDNVHDASGHDEIGLTAIYTVEVKHSDGQGSEMLAFDHDERPKERSVVAHKAENGEGNQAGA